MARIDLKRILLSTLLIAVGTGAIILLMCTAIGQNLVHSYIVLWAALWFGSGGLIGAGAFSPFKRASLGAVVGVLVQFVIVANELFHLSPLG